jgi:uncharacterized membrane protein YfcA
MGRMVVLLYTVIGVLALVSALVAYLRQPEVDLLPAQMLVAAAGAGLSVAAYFLQWYRAEVVMLGVTVVAAVTALRTMRRHQAGRRDRSS